MRYITDNNGYLLQVSFGADIECNGRGCTEYTGGVPSGYSSLVDWFAKEGDKLYRWKIAGGQLALDGSVPVKGEPSLRRIYVAHGMIMNDPTSGEGVRGTGTATINIEPNGIARIDFVLKIEYSGVNNENAFTYGINRDMLQLINSNIPTITPMSCGAYTVYSDDGTVNADITGYGGSFTAKGQFWSFGRVYTREDYKGTYSMWNQVMFTAGMRIVGTCFGTVD